MEVNQPAVVEEEQERSWLIVGGGIMGLRLAELLLRRGQKVTLYEASPRIGGFTQPWRVGDVEWERYFHGIVNSDAALRSLLRDIGLDGEIEWVHARTGLFCEGKLHRFSNWRDFLRFPPLGLWDKAKWAWTIAYCSNVTQGISLEQEPIEAWLHRMIGHNTYTKVWVHLLRSRLGPLFRDCSAAYAWSTISRWSKARRDGYTKKLMGYLPGGYARILEIWQRRLESMGLAIHCDHKVLKIGTDRESHGQVEVEFENTKSNVTQTIRFDSVISTLPATITTHVIPQLNFREYAKLEAIDYIGMVCTSMLMKKPLSEKYVTHVVDPTVSMASIVETTNVVDRSKFRGHHLVYLPQYCVNDDPIFDSSDGDIVDSNLASLQRVFPNFDPSAVVATRVARSRYVMPLPKLNYSANRPDVLSSLPGVYLLNSAHVIDGTLNANATIEACDRWFENEIWPDVLYMSGSDSRF